MKSVYSKPEIVITSYEAESIMDLSVVSNNQTNFVTNSFNSVDF